MKQSPFIGAARKRARIMAYLRQHKRLSTLEARERLGIMHPAARILELRDAGANIITHWRTETDAAGTTHRVGEYVLLSGKRKTPAGTGAVRRRKINTGGRADER